MDTKKDKKVRTKESPKKEAKLYVTVRLEALKTDLDKGKELLKGDTQRSLIFRTIHDGDGKLTFAQLVEAITPKLTGKTQKTITANAAWYVTKMVADGFVKRNETKEQRDAK
jgi:hypothetical protein